MRSFIYGMVTTTLLLAATDARAEVFRCTDTDGGVIYQQTPCPEPKPEKEDAQKLSPQGAGADEDAVEQERIPPVKAEAKSPEVIAQCKKKYRDAIDAIDAEMRRDYSSEQGEAYRQRLRVLTEKLRDC